MSGHFHTDQALIKIIIFILRSYIYPLVNSEIIRMDLKVV